MNKVCSMEKSTDATEILPVQAIGEFDWNDGARRGQD